MTEVLYRITDGVQAARLVSPSVAVFLSHISCGFHFASIAAADAERRFSSSTMGLAAEHDLILNGTGTSNTYKQSHEDWIRWA